MVLLVFLYYYLEAFVGMGCKSWKEQSRMTVFEPMFSRSESSSPRRERKKSSKKKKHRYEMGVCGVIGEA